MEESTDIPRYLTTKELKQIQKSLTKNTGKDVIRCNNPLCGKFIYYYQYENTCGDPRTGLYCSIDCKEENSSYKSIKRVEEVKEKHKMGIRNTQTEFKHKSLPLTLIIE